MSGILPHTAIVSGADAVVKSVSVRLLCFMSPSAKSQVRIQCIETTLGAVTIRCVASLTRQGNQPPHFAQSGIRFTGKSTGIHLKTNRNLHHSKP